VQSYLQEQVTSNENKAVTVVIPAYNEEKRIKPVLTEICNYISSNDLPWNVIISIDGNDSTDLIVERMMDDFPFLSYIKGKGRNGKGGAIKRAVNIASGEFIVLMDADGSISLENLTKSIDFMDFYDFIIFDRYSNPENNIPFMRRFASRGFNILLRGIMGIRINDTQCGYKIIRSEYAKDAFNKISVSNTFFDVALFYYMNRRGAKSVEIPVRYSHDGESKFNVIGEVIGQGTSLFAFRIRNSRFYKYVPRKLVELYYRKFRWI
jgi:glycosyltransferase involved in cell wall biosynthesis